MTKSQDPEACERTPRIPVSATAVNITGSRNAFADYDPSIRETRAAVTGAALLSGALDKLTVELVRLRNGQLQGCNF
jgi:hypothetical protein